MFLQISREREKKPKNQKRSRNCWNSRAPKTPPRCIYMYEFIFLTKETCYRLRLQNVSGRRMVTMMEMVTMIARNHKRRVRCTVFISFSATAKPSRDSGSIIKLVPTCEGLILREKEPKFSERERDRKKANFCILKNGNGTAVMKEQNGWCKWWWKFFLFQNPCFIFGFVKDRR